MDEGHESRIRIMPEYSSSLTELVRRPQGINPVVFQATTNTMLYSALFRYAQRNRPESFAAFLQSLPPTPRQVRTPSTMFVE